jgi:hypothetical protein
LSTEVARAFEAIVSTVEPEHFKPVDVPLIAQLATARVLLDRADVELERAGAVVDGRPSPWLTVRVKELRAVITLSTRLRLTPQSRYDARAAARSHVYTGPRPWEIGSERDAAAS